jgi:hypothetical protein
MAELKLCKVCKTNMLLKFFQSNLKTDVMYKSCDKCRARIRSKFACNECDYKCGRAVDLKAHKDCVHLKLKTYACNKCELSFGESKNLKDHKDCVHLKLKQFACSECEMKFGQVGSLKSHNDCVHLKLKPYECNECDYKCGRAGDLKAHKLICTGELNCSSGELAVMKILDKMKIDYLYNTTFWGVRDKALLRWDFIISPANDSKVIEYDGECHFFPVRYGGITEQEAQENLVSSKRRDAIKDDYCVANSIPILRIPYYEKDNIAKLISEFV